MPKLIDTVEAAKYNPYIEHWALENDLIARVYFNEDECEVTFRSNTGDVTDQLYEIFQEQGIFLDAILGGVSCYMIEIVPKDVMALLEAAERIDSTRLKKGKTY